MADIMTPQQRHDCMAAVKGKDTKPEMLVRRFLHAAGFRYGLHNRRLPGTPDIVLRKHKTVIFVNGCFWHGHEGCKYAHLPQTNAEFWRAKIERNRARDARDTATLRSQGWRVIVIWECELKTAALRQATLLSLLATLRPAYLVQTASGPSCTAAEPPSPYGQK